VVALAVPAYADPTDDDGPGTQEVPAQAEVDAAKARAEAAELSLGEVQAELATANQELRRLDARLLAAIEAYNTAVDKLNRASVAHLEARAEWMEARLDLIRQRRIVSKWVATDYQQHTPMRELGAYLTAEGPRTLLEQSGLSSMTAATLDKAMADLRAAETVARVLERQTRKAAQVERDATKRAEEAKRLAQDAELGQREKVEKIKARQKAMLERLAELRDTSVRLEQQRQAALARRNQERSEAERQAAAEARGADGSGRDDEDGEGGRSGGGEVWTRQGRIAVDFALDQLGEPYVFGAAGPSVWDCSGLTKRAWEKAGVTMPHYARGQYWGSQKISLGELRPGDLLFWADDPNDSNTIYHVAIYIGDGDMAHAPRPGRTVERTSMWYMGAPTHLARPG
ncbi:MAG TPA: NlpC/P60 family protein, partial [Actinopolymorphaceae bacterium]